MARKGRRSGIPANVLRIRGALRLGSRDRETKLDYMLARYYGDAVPRFLSPDPIGGSAGRPQTWNRYAYVLGNPMRLVDPSGMYSTGVGVSLGGWWQSGPGGSVGWGHIPCVLCNEVEGGGASDIPVGLGKGLYNSVTDAGNLVATGMNWGLSLFTDVRIPLAPSAEASNRVQWHAMLAAGLAAMVLSDGEGAASQLNISSKIERQMVARGWTRESIVDAMNSGEQVSAANKATGASAIRYIHPETGQSVVVDRVTNEVIHVGGPGFRYGPGSGDLP